MNNSGSAWSSDAKLLSRKWHNKIQLTRQTELRYLNPFRSYKRSQVLKVHTLPDPVEAELFGEHLRMRRNRERTFQVAGFRATAL